MDSNTFNLTSSQLTAISYVEGSFFITEGESSSPPPTFAKNGSTWTITIGANRKGSEPVANSFNEKSGGSFHEYTNASGDKSPEELNFYFGVILTFNVSNVMVPVTVYLGQGHYTANNNWWIGGNSIYNDGSPVLNVISGGQILEVLRITGSGNYSMTLTPLS